MTIRSWLVTMLALLFMPLSMVGLAQSPASRPAQSLPELNDIAISPSRIELRMLPGTEKTVVVNLIYSGVRGKAESTRIVAYLGDWDMSRQGQIEFYKPGTKEQSACPWMIYSPGEMIAVPGQANAIRVTVSVPKDATPGDHLAVLLVEPRVDDLKLEQDKKQVRMKFRLASIFYVMVPDLTQHGSLENLKAEEIDRGVVVTASLRNEGNCHVRPSYSIKVLDQAGTTAAELPETESLPVLARSKIDMSVAIEKELPAGNYDVRYRVRFTDGGPITEGQTVLQVKERSEQKTAPSPRATPSKQQF